MEFLDYFTVILLTFIISMGVVWVIHPYLVKVAKLKDIVDNPNARKLQKEPIPVLGGAAVFFGIFISLAFASILIDCSTLFVLLTTMLMMLYLGSIDDILGIQPSWRLCVQIIAVLMLIFLGENYEINSMLGLWGIDALPKLLSVLLTVFAAVGIINAINLIDGVDGLSSGYGVMACVFFALAFLYVGDIPMLALCASMIGALTLFFLHNVFGKKSKMFIGDGGALVLGIVMATFVIRLLSSVRALPVGENLASAIPFTLAVLSIPVFDTLRVMSTRIIKKKSPFHPDKTHLHHMFIDLGFPHAMTTTCILLLNMMIVVIWWLMYYNGISPEIQTISIILLNVLCTFGLYHLVKWIKTQRPENYIWIEEQVRIMQPRRKRLFLSIQKIVDRI